MTTPERFTKITDIIDEVLTRAYLRGDDVKAEVANGAVFGAVYASLCIHGLHVNASRMTNELIITRLDVVLAKIRIDKIDKFIKLDT